MMWYRSSSNKRWEDRGEAEDIEDGGVVPGYLEDLLLDSLDS